MLLHLLGAHQASAIAGAPVVVPQLQRTRPARAARYLWAAPTTAIGLIFAFLTWLTGGHLQWRDGVLEVSRGLARSMLESPRLHAGAITLGHVVLGRDPDALARHRLHEQGHVRQAERLGPFFLPAYFAAAAAAHLRGGHYYRDNWFERDADRYAAAVARAIIDEGRGAS